MTRATDYTDKNGLSVFSLCKSVAQPARSSPTSADQFFLTDRDHNHALLSGRGDHLFAFGFRVQRFEAGRFACDLRLVKEVAIVVTFEHEFRVVGWTAVYNVRQNHRTRWTINASNLKHCSIRARVDYANRVLAGRQVRFAGSECERDVGDHSLRAGRLCFCCTRAESCESNA